MDYKDYQNSRDAVWRLLIDMQIKELPVKVSKICRDLGIKIKTGILENNSGLSVIIDGSPMILVNKNDIPARQRFTVAHELGHIILGHVGKYKLVNREPQADDNPIEQAANVFASRLIAPACVLWGLNCRTAEEISKVCDISITSAKFRMERMKLLYERDKFLSSPLEKQVFKQFSTYIKENKL